MNTELNVEDSYLTLGAVFDVQTMNLTGTLTLPGFLFHLPIFRIEYHPNSLFYVRKASFGALALLFLVLMLEERIQLHPPTDTRCPGRVCECWTEAGRGVCEVLRRPLFADVAEWAWRGSWVGCCSQHRLTVSSQSGGVAGCIMLMNHHGLCCGPGAAAGVSPVSETGSRSESVCG